MTNFVNPKDSAPEDYFEADSGHQQISWNDFGDNWFCVSCYKVGTQYPTDRPEDKPCIPRERPTDWNRVYG